jgi:pimeloyl-ACP methyl ester carboxylesterase
LSLLSWSCSKKAITKSLPLLAAPHALRDPSADSVPVCVRVRSRTPGGEESDRTVDEISFDAFVSDLGAVVAAARLTRFALFGISQGCAISIAYAVRHPERVSHVVLYGGFALGHSKRARTAAQKDQDAAMLTLMRVGWGQENVAFRQLLTSQFIPAGPRSRPSGSMNCGASRSRRRWPPGIARQPVRSMSRPCFRGLAWRPPAILNPQTHAQCVIG